MATTNFGVTIFIMELIREFQSVLDCQEPWHISGEDREVYAFDLKNSIHTAAISVRK